jgi:branched-chain amino acid transport system permease protein
MMKYAGFELDTHATRSWVWAVLALMVGSGVFEGVRRSFVKQWGAVQEEIEARMAKGAA